MDERLNILHAVRITQITTKDFTAHIVSEYITKHRERKPPPRLDNVKQDEKSWRVTTGINAAEMP